MYCLKRLNAETPGRNVAKLMEKPCGSASSRLCVKYIFKNKATEVSGDFSRDLRGNG